MIHPTAEVSDHSIIGKNTKIWHQAQVRERSKIGSNCIISKGVYIDSGVKIGDNVKIQNYSSIYHGASIEGGVFIGPHVIIANDKFPRAVNKDGTLKSESDWQCGKKKKKKGASIGAGSIILPDVTIGSFALIGAGSVVTKNVPDNALVVGSPAKHRGFVCSKGHKTQDKNCPICNEKIE